MNGKSALYQWSPTFLAPGAGFVEDRFSMDRAGGGGGHGSGGNVNDGEQWGMADEASLTCLPLISYCVVHFLTGHRPVLVLSLGVGDPCFI